MLTRPFSSNEKKRAPERTPQRRGAPASGWLHNDRSVHHRLLDGSLEVPANPITSGSVLRVSKGPLGGGPTDRWASLSGGGDVGRRRRRRRRRAHSCNNLFSVCLNFGKVSKTEKLLGICRNIAALSACFPHPATAARPPRRGGGCTGTN